MSVTPVHTMAPPWFYPVGNTPPVCLTQNLPPGLDAALLLLGCGDFRNILFTMYSESKTSEQQYHAIGSIEIILTLMMIKQVSAEGSTSRVAISPQKSLPAMFSRCLSSLMTSKANVFSSSGTFTIMSSSTPTPLEYCDCRLKSS